MSKRILEELRHHAPFTILGAVIGMLFMVFSARMPHQIAYSIFYILHPMHVVLSSLVTASIYNLHTCKQPGVHQKGKCNLWLLFIIGYVGSVGIATLSDSVIPFLGETMLGMPHRQVHIGFIEKWWLINPLAIIGITIAYKRPSTKFPHLGHVLISTWASIFHIKMAAEGTLSLSSYAVVFAFLFLSVWLPCCISDIVFPLLFVKKK
ncbi:MAG: hypothetical protein JW869_01140 [Candidatus Omnitrophica bacterium]|nr:hypothetical protein [Candidatus Omnitrophota bacterium]